MEKFKSLKIGKHKSIGLIGVRKFAYDKYNFSEREEELFDATLDLPFGRNYAFF